MGIGKVEILAFNVDDLKHPHRNGLGQGSQYRKGAHPRMRRVTTTRRSTIIVHVLYLSLHDLRDNACSDMLYDS
jgi:hypothetical protein